MKLKIKEEKEEEETAMISLEEGGNGKVFVKSVVKGVKLTELVICPDGTKYYALGDEGNFKKEEWK